MTSHFQLVIAMLFLAYLFGSISSAIIVCKLMGLPDPRTQGSQNPGATNVLRIGGKLPAALTLCGDVMKGVIPVLIAKWYRFDDIAIAEIILATLLGHLYPIFFRFQGGKGVATAWGCLLALYWPLGISLAVTWLIVAILFRYSSLAALTVAILAPLYTWCATDNVVYTLAVIIISAILIVRHRNNIGNFLAGQESRIGQKKPPEKPS
jgi:glycerol-3-phosphate acyltransferase PlsY